MNEENTSSEKRPREQDGLEAMCAGILRTQFGRRESRALKNAMVRLEAEQAAARSRPRAQAKSWIERFLTWASPVQSPARLGFAAGLLIVIGVSVWFLWSQGVLDFRGAPPNQFCKISDSFDAQWVGRASKPKVGDFVEPAALKLESGLVELAYSSGVKVAIEGPAQFKVPTAASLELLSGKISAVVPRGGRGFTVKSPTASTVDLGTRFGEIVNAQQASEVDVFEGKVEVTANGAGANRWQLTQGKGLIADARTAMEATALPESAFPQPTLTMLARPQNCGFDVSARAVTGGVPVDFGYWSGPAFSLTGYLHGIRPVEGAGMLQFLDPPGSSGDSTVWQLIDLRRFKKFLASGLVEGRLSSMFNRIEGEGLPPGKFGLTLAAFHGPLLYPDQLWVQRATAAVALADKELTTDNDPKTWEKIEVSAKLPPETDFVIIEIRAIAPNNVPIQGKVFPGHFADLVDFKLTTRLRPSSISTSR